MCQMCRFILSITNVYYDNMVSQIYPSELQLYKVNTSDTEAAFVDLIVSIPVLCTLTYFAFIYL